MLGYNYTFWDNWGLVVFTFSPSFSPVSQRQPRVLRLQFGDGYEQRSPDGINHDLRSWSLTFQHCPSAEADQIEAFFVTNQTAIQPFAWTPPRAAAAAKFVCRGWRRVMESPVTDTISCTFEEVADP